MPSEVRIPAIDARWVASLPTDIEHACKIGDLAAVLRHLERGGNVNARSICQSQMLHLAVRYQQAAIVHLLLRVPAVDVNALDYGGLRRTALHWACLRGDHLIVEELIVAGAMAKDDGATWQQLVQGRSCGGAVPVASLPSETPADLCTDQTVRLALQRPAWSPDLHAQFPRAFRKAAKLLMLVATNGDKSEPAASHKDSAGMVATARDENDDSLALSASGPIVPAAAAASGDSPLSQSATWASASPSSWPLTADLTRVIISIAAYPISSWV